MSESSLVERILDVVLARRAGQFAAGQQMILIIILLGNHLGIYSISNLWTTALFGLLIVMVSGSPIWLRTRRFYTPEIKQVKCPACGPGYYKTTSMQCDHCGAKWSAGKPSK